MQHKIKDLDDVLSYLASSFAKPRVQVDTILKHLQKRDEWENEGYYLDKILDKLIKDGYAELISQLHGVFEYSITWNGIHFHQSGGYDHKLKEEASLNRVEGIVYNLQRRTYWLTAAIVVGTSVAAIYYFFEILKDFRVFVK